MWNGLSSRQKRVLFGLGLANVLLLGAIGALTWSPATDTKTVQPPTPSDTSLACQAEGAHALSVRHVAGTVALSADGAIEFTLSGADPTDAWDAFAVAAELTARGCGPYDPIRVDVPDPSLVDNQRLIVEARWEDVQIWSQGRIDDEALSERTRRATYARGHLGPLASPTP